MSVSLATLKTRLKQLTDRENSSAFSDAELGYLLESGINSLYDLLVQVYEDYFITSMTFDTVAGTHTYALPNGSNYESVPEGEDPDEYDGPLICPSAFYKAKGVDIDIGGGELAALKLFDFKNRNKASYSNAPERYQIIGSNIRLWPTPTDVRRVTLWYIPVVLSYTYDLDFPIAPGWEQFVLCHAAIFMREKMEEDASFFMLQKQKFEQDIRKAAQQRVAGDVMTMADTRDGDLSWEEEWAYRA